MSKTIRNPAVQFLLAACASMAVSGLAVITLPGSASAAEAGSAGTFRNADRAYPASGRVEIVKLEGGGLGVKLESNFKVRTAPDLRVWLSESSNPTNAGNARQGRYVDLGRLKSSSGEQIYRIPANVDLEKTRSVIIWCRAFGVFVGSASLT